MLDRRTYRVGEWIVEPSLDRISCGTTQLKLEPKAMQVLVELMLDAGMVVTSDELVERVWRGRPMGDNPVYKCISSLRSALGDDPQSPKYIGTVPRKGYRLLVASEVLVDEEKHSGTYDSDAGSENTPPKGIGAMYATLALIIAAIGLSWSFFQLTTNEGSPSASGGDAIPSMSIAVLPFDTLDDQGPDERLTLGLHDDILTQVSKIRSLRVISRTSVERLDPNMDIREIAKLLRVATVLEGSVQRVGDQLRINAQLIDAQTDAHLWAETYNHEISTRNVFDVQSKIAVSVARSLEAALSPQEYENLTRLPTQSLTAYEAFLFGAQATRLRTKPALTRAIRHFEKAIRIDSDYSHAYVGLATAKLLLHEYGDLSFQVAMDESRRLLDRAIELEPSFAGAHATLGLRSAKQGRFAEAQNHYETAINLDPNYAPAYHWYGEMLVNGTGQHEAALPILEKARELNPLAPVVGVTLGEAYEGAGRFEDAMDTYRSVIAMDPDYPGAYFAVASLYRFGYGRLDEAVRWFTADLRVNPERPPAELGLTYLDLGDESRAEYWISRAYQSHPNHFRPVAAMALLSLFRRDEREAIHYARRLNEISNGNNRTMFVMVSFGRYKEALELYRQLDIADGCPDLLVDRSNFFYAINISLAMEQTIDQACAARMLTSVLDVIRAVPRFGARGFGIADVEIYARRGETQVALAKLREAIDQGWRAMWWAQGTGSPHNASIGHHPEFLAMMDEVRSDVAAQLGRVRAMEARGEIDVVPPDFADASGSVTH